MRSWPWAFLMFAAAVWAQEGSFASGFRPTMSPELAARLKTADVAAGERFFERKCGQCHDGDKSGGHAKGPFLWNWYGRKAGSIAGFAFSPAMRQAGVVWDYATLDHYLADTERAVPGRAMDFMGIPDARLRAAVIAWLRRMNDVPPPLPE